MHTLQDYFSKWVPEIESHLAREIEGLNSIVAPLARHVLFSGGKRLRPILCMLTAAGLGYSEERALPLACSLELAHSATLLHDDVLDGAELRRGATAAHLSFGTTETILAGDALLALANKIVTSYNSITLVSCLSETIYQTATGEILEIEKMKDTSLSEQEYLEIIIGKTGYLMQTCCQSSAILAESDSDLEEAAKTFGLNLGIAFQLIDDAMDYTKTEDLTGKPLGGDLREGKLTLPLIFFLQSLQEEEQQDVLTKIKEKRLPQEEEKWIIDQIYNRHFSQKTREEAMFYLQKASGALSLFPSNQAREFLREMIDFIRDRDS